MNVNVNVDLFATITVEHDEPRRDSRDWRNVSDGPKRKRPAARRQSTRKAALAAHIREGGGY